jgi:hypothetical protein
MTDVTMFQRSSTYIMSIKNGWKVMFTGTLSTSIFPPIPSVKQLPQLGIYSENAPPTDVADRLSASFSHHLSIGLSQRRTKKIAEMDKCVSLLF